MGSGAQEENLFRRTTLFDVLCCGEPSLAERGYPLPRDGGVYCRCLVFRSSEATGYAVMRKPVEIGCISVAGLKRPKCVWMRRTRQGKGRVTGDIPRLRKGESEREMSEMIVDGRFREFEEVLGDFALTEREEAVMEED